MKVYISGAITGTSDYMERFAEAQKFWESLGHDVINPALVNSNLPKSTSYDEYMKMSFLMLGMCDAIYMLQGYHRSEGAKCELNVAQRTDKIVIYEDDPCYGCAWNDPDQGCTCSDLEKWYQCRLEPAPTEEDFST